MGVPSKKELMKNFLDFVKNGGFKNEEYFINNKI